MNQLDVARRIAQSAISSIDLVDVSESLTDEEFDDLGDDVDGALVELHRLVLGRVAQ